MKIKSSLRLLAVLLSLALALSLVACTGSKPGNDPAPVTPGGQDDPGTDSPDGPEGDDDVAVVKTAEEFLEAIAPGMKIELRLGSCNLSDFLEPMNGTDMENWNASHEYVKLEEEFDGLEVHVINADGLNIYSTSSEDPSELVVDPRYATVITFENCDDLTLSDMVLGHTELGSCVGNVLDFAGCRNVKLNRLDIYGCGVIGVSAWGGSGDFSVTDCFIHDCEWGPFSFEEIYGSVEFDGSTFTGSGSGGTYYSSPASSLTFKNCKFGEWESNIWSFRDDAEFIDCELEEPTSYPDVDPDYVDGEYYGPVLDREKLSHVSFDYVLLEGSYWTGLYLDNINDPTLELPYEDEAGTVHSIGIKFNANGTGTLFGYNAIVTGVDEDIDFTWELDSEYSGVLRFADSDAEGTLTVYLCGEGGDGDLWLAVSIFDDTIWAM